MINTTVWLSNGKKFTTKPIQDTFAVVLTTYNHFRLSRPSYNRQPNYDPNNPTKKWSKGLPDTWQYQGRNNLENSFVPLTPTLAFFWYEQCKALDVGHNTDYYYKAFDSLTADDRFTTNKFGSRTCYNPVTGTNKGAELMRFITLLTGNAVIKLKEGFDPTANLYPFYCINANTPLTNISYSKTPWLFYFPMNSVRTPLLDANGKWLHGRVEYQENGYGRFPQFSGKAITPLFMPYTNTGWIERSNVRLLKQDEAFPLVFNM